MAVRYKMSAETFIARFLERTNFLPAIKKWTPDLLEEVRGISDGAGVAFDTILVFQMADEIWARNGDVVGDHCSSIGVNKHSGSPSFVGQTMDIPWLYQGYQTLLRIKHENSTLESYVLTAAGLIGLNGLNNSPVAINCNTLLQLKSSRDGLPVAFVVRAVLEKKTLEEATAFLRSVGHASGQNYIVGDKEKAISLECSANKIVPFAPLANAGVTYHTNHPLANDDYTPAYAASLKRPFYGTSGHRLASLESRLKTPSRPIDLELIKTALSSRDSEAAPVSNDLTFACTVMVLSAKPELHVTVGRPDQNPFQVFTFQ